MVARRTACGERALRSGADPASLQEARYGFPYHYLPRLSERGFSQTAHLRWGYVYLANLRFVLDLLTELEPQSLLDVGCGDGRFLLELRRRLPEAELAGIDPSARAIALARAMDPEGEYLCGELSDPELAARTFDTVTLLDVLEHITPEHIAGFRASLLGRLRPGGRLIVTVPTLNVPLAPKHHQHFDTPSLAEALGTELQLEQSRFLNRRSRIVRAIDRLLTNRLYVVREPRILLSFFRLYERRWALATERSGATVCAVLRRAENPNR
jgi:2-polyprenyl-3-methyl-5-hydroxy-6-metoxy-1,4-benzoquinol methylase